MTAGLFSYPIWIAYARVFLTKPTVTIVATAKSARISMLGDVEASDPLNPTAVGTLSAMNLGPDQHGYVSDVVTVQQY